MANKFTLFAALSIFASMLLMTPFQLSAGQTIGKVNESEVASATGNTSDISPVSDNTITLNATEMSEEQYRWTDRSGVENPTLKLVANNEYTFKIYNPTDEEHELIIDSKDNNKTSEIAKSDEVEPGDNTEFTFTADQTGELGYYCEYHPDMMNGTITIFAAP